MWFVWLSAYVYVYVLSVYVLCMYVVECVCSIRVLFGWVCFVCGAFWSAHVDEVNLMIVVFA